MTSKPSQLLAGLVLLALLVRLLAELLWPALPMLLVLYVLALIYRLLVDRFRYW